MNWTKSIKAVVVFILIMLVTLKLADMVIGLVSSNNFKKEDPIEISRFISLREFNPDPYLDQIYKPSDSYMSHTQNLEQKEYRVRTDANGFIVGEKDFSKKIQAQKIDIIFWGGSTTECLWVEEENRFPYLVSENLKNRNREVLRVVNGGVSGNNSMHSLFAHEAKGIPLEPSFAVMMDAINDMTLLTKTLSYWDAPDSKAFVKSLYASKPIAKKEISVEKNIFFPNIAMLVQKVVSQKQNAEIITDEWEVYRKRKYATEKIVNALETQFRSSLKSFVSVNRAWGIEPILMTQFNRLNTGDVFVRKAYEENQQPVSYNEFVRLYKRSNEIVREVANEEKVFLIDLDKQVPQTSEFIYDSVHVNTKGSKVVAGVISKALLKQYPRYFKTLDGN